MGIPPSEAHGLRPTEGRGVRPTRDRRPSPPWLLPAPALLTVAEAARVLRIHPNTLRSWGDKGLVPMVRMPNGYRRFAVVEIEEVRRTMGLDRTDPDGTDGDRDDSGSDT